MFDSLATLTTAQTVRTATFPLQLAAPSPTLEWLLETPRERNAALDALFYDVGTLQLEEARSVALRYAAEGAILEVGPSSAPSLHTWRNYGDFAGHRGDYAALVVAGVGSSALGAAAFARNVADAADGPVLAVVSGYGLADMAAEALGGYFLFGSLNSSRQYFEWLDDWRLSEGLGALPAGLADPFSGAAVARRCDDVRTLVRILAGPTRFDWLVGHSKGNLVLSEALYALRDGERPAFDALCAHTDMITVSAKIVMPRGPARIVDVMGDLDTFGAMNSRLAIETDVAVPMAWHHTNTELPFHLPVAETLRTIIAGQKRLPPS